MRLPDRFVDGVRPFHGADSPRHGAFYLGKLGTTVGWGINIGMALIVAATIGSFTGEWKGASKGSVRTLLAGIGVLIFVMVILAYANSLAD